MVTTYLAHGQQAKLYESMQHVYNMTAKDGQLLVTNVRGFSEVLKVTINYTGEILAHN